MGDYKWLPAITRQPQLRADGSTASNMSVSVMLLLAAFFYLSFQVVLTSHAFKGAATLYVLRDLDTQLQALLDGRDGLLQLGVPVPIGGTDPSVASNVTLFQVHT